MLPQARRFDLTIGVCTCLPPTFPSSSGLVMMSSNTHFADNFGVARRFDMVLGNCGNVGIIMTSSQTCNTDNLGRARQYSMFTGCYTGMIIKGSPTVMVGD